MIRARSRILRKLKIIFIFEITVLASSDINLRVISFLILLCFIEIFLFIIALISFIFIVYLVMFYVYHNIYATILHEFISKIFIFISLTFIIDFSIIMTFFSLNFYVRFLFILHIQILISSILYDSQIIMFTFSFNIFN